MTRFISILNLGTILLIAGCGANLKELNVEEKERFKATLATIGHSTSAIAALGKKNSPSASNIPDANVSHLFEALAAGAPASRESSEMARRLESAVTYGHCTLVNNLPKDVSATKVPKLVNARFTLSGSRCPVTMDLSVNTDGDEKSGSVRFDIKYTVQDAEFKALAQLDQVELAGTVYFNINMPTDTSAPQNFSMRFETDIHGSVQTVKEGLLKNYIKGRFEMNGNTGSSADQPRVTSNGEFAFGIEFKQFTAELKATANMDSASQKNESKFYLNNKEITQAEMAEWIAHVGVPLPPTPPVGR